MAWEGWTEENTALTKRRFQAGEHPRKIARDLGCSPSTVVSKAWRERWRCGPTDAPVPPAMRRLAQHDPIVARALAVRERAA